MILATEWQWGTGIVARLAIAATCSLILITAAPVAFNAIADPYVVPKGRTSRALRGFYVRCGRKLEDGMSVEVLLASVLLISPPLLAVMSTPTLRIETMLLFAAAAWAVRRPTVDLEHGDAHYAFFRPRVEAASLDRWILRTLNWFSEYPLALCTGRIPHGYFVQHVTVHHAENNGPEDTQSTVPYDRASFAGFAVCAQRFALSGLVPADVVCYLLSRHRTKALRKLCFGYSIYIGFLTLLSVYSLGAALLLIAVRYASLVADAASFFQEHGLVDPDQPGEIITNSLHYMAADNDHGSRGEDLHVEHHIRPGLHWSLYPAAMASRIADYERHHAIGFHDGPGQLRAYYRCLWRDDFAGLAEHVRVFGCEGMTPTDVEHLLRRRTAPAGPRPWCPPPAWIEQPAGRLAALII